MTVTLTRSPPAPRLAAGSLIAHSTAYLELTTPLGTSPLAVPKA